MPGTQLPTFCTGPTTKVRLNFGLRWDINPAIMFARARAGVVGSTGKLGRLVKLGPLGLPVGPTFKALAALNMNISLDFLVGRDETGRWGGFCRGAAGVGQEASAFSMLDMLEDVASGYHPLLNGIPTPVIWGDQTVPLNELDYLASGAAWYGLSTAFSDAPTSGSLTFGALGEGYFIYRLPTFEIPGDAFAQQALALETWMQRLGLKL